MAIKLLISGFENTGKSTTASKIKDAFVVNIDRKEYGFAVPHINITDFTGIDNFIDTINEKLGIYQEKYDKLPNTIVFDTVTQLYSAIQHYNENQYKGFDVHKNNNRDTLNFNAYVEDVLIANGVNVIIVAHTVWDEATARHVIPATGQFGKCGSWLSVVSEAIFLEKKSGKIIVHEKSMKFPARTTLPDIKDSEDSSVYDINTHIAKLTAAHVEAEDFRL